MKEICEVRNSIYQIKAKPDVHNEHVKGSKQLQLELDTQDTIIKLLDDIFKQIAGSIVNPILLNFYSESLIFQKISILYCQKKYLQRESKNKSKLTDTILQNPYQMLEPTSENVEAKPKTIQMLIQCSLADIVHRNKKTFTSQK